MDAVMPPISDAMLTTHGWTVEKVKYVVTTNRVNLPFAH
jgi:hypothetical protein